MERPYVKDTVRNPKFFVGDEVEGTPFLGLKTLFVVGIQPIDKIVQYYQEEGVDHVFLGANLSFEHTPEWEDFLLIVHDLDEISRITVDMTIEEYYTMSKRVALDKMRKLWVLARVVIPSYPTKNVTIKVDDEAFGETTPGVLTLTPHNLFPQTHFTSWDEYKTDRILE